MLESNEICNKQSDLMAFVKDVKGRLLLDRNIAEAKFNDQCIFVGFFMETVSKVV